MLEMNQLLKSAYNNHFAIPAINFESFEVLRALAKGASECDSPIIVQTTEPALEEMGITNIVNLAKFYSNQYEVPLVLHLDHATSEKTIVDCIKSGYKSVMIDASEEQYAKNVSIVKKIVEYAHGFGVAVEAGIGIVGENGVNDLKTDLESAISYVEETKVDSVAISVGNTHGGRTKTRNIDFGLLEKINTGLEMPLVLHGSSGIVNEDLSKAMNYGICKVNIETELRVLYRESIQNFLRDYPTEIKIRKMNAYVRDIIVDFVKRKSEIFKSKNMSSLLKID